MNRNNPTKKADQLGLRQQNTHLLLRLIQVSGPISQAELARQTGLSRGSVSEILQPLLNQNVLVEEGKIQPPGGGRRASLLTFNNKKMVVVGVVIDQEMYEVGLIGLSANVLGYATQTYPPSATPDEAVELVAVSLNTLLTENNISPEAVVGIGVTVPGVIDPEAGIIKVASNLGWHNVPIKALLQSKFNLPVRFDHIGHAQVIAESLWGNGVGKENVVCIQIGTGIGAGVIMGGHLLGGRSGSLEVGHISLDVNGPECSCGLRGCWEIFCAGPAIRRRLSNYLEEMPLLDTVLTQESTLRELGQAAEKGDALAQKVLDETVPYMVRGLINVIWSYDPDLCILSGFVVRDCPYLIEATRLALREVKAVRDVDIPIVATGQGVYPRIIAASALVSKNYLEELAYRVIAPT